MVYKIRSFFIYTSILGVFTVGLEKGICSPPVIGCSDIAGIEFFDLEFAKPVTITEAKIYEATATAPEHCNVQGTIWPEIGFAVKLPTQGWNQKVLYYGGGGYNGMINSRSMLSSLALGYASAASNGGHDAKREPGGTFGWENPHNPNPNPNAKQKLIDYGYRSGHEAVNLLKKIARAYYGSDPYKSYFTGCSTGGREGLMAAQRYPEDFDGILIGAPTGSMLGTPLRGLWNTQQGTGGPGKIAREKLLLLNTAVYGKCDKVDGLVDGLIDDPRNCSFDPLIDLPACPDDADKADCFTFAQRTALKKIYQGPRDTKGKQLFVGQPLSAEYLTKPGDPKSSGFTAALMDPLAQDFFRYWVFEPPPGPAWDYMTFNWDVDPGRMAASNLSAILDATTFDPRCSPNQGGLAAFKSRGGKMLHYHGWGDSLVSPLISTNFYEAVLAAMGVKETKQFYRLYMFPGTGHCGGGVGCFTRGSSDNELFAALVDWVEKGIEPQSIIGSRAATPEFTARTRPICPYPEVAKHNGTGSVDEAENFSCAPAIQVKDSSKESAEGSPLLPPPVPSTDGRN